jgi:hypothetical protein
LLHLVGGHVGQHRRGSWQDLESPLEDTRLGARVGERDCAGAWIGLGGEVDDSSERPSLYSRLTHGDARTEVELDPFIEGVGLDLDFHA